MELPDTSPSTPELGDRLEVFGPSRANIAAGFIITALITLGGVLLVVWGVTGLPEPAGGPRPADKDEPKLRIALAVLGVVMLVPALAFGIYARHLLSFRMDWHANGFRYRAGERNRVVLWSDIERVIETV